MSYLKLEKLIKKYGKTAKVKDVIEREGAL